MGAKLKPNPQKVVESYDFKVCTWPAFMQATDLPSGLLDRAYETIKEWARPPHSRTWVVYDPIDDNEGWLLIGEYDDILNKTLSDKLDLDPENLPC